MRSLALMMLILVACSDPPPSRDDSGLADAGARDAAPSIDAPSDDGGSSDSGAPADAPPAPDAPVVADAGPSCLDDHAAGDRFPVGDGCNFCDCEADGSTTCTTRSCAATTIGGCDYDGTSHPYAARFPATDGCNECVCAASGLACTRRACTVVEEGAILLESLDEPCGGIPDFTPQRVLDTMPFSELTAPFLYNRGGPLYPESLPDTTVTLRIVYDGGYAVCRIPMPGQEAIDLEASVEWITADGEFDEGFHTYLRRNAGGFVDAWFIDGAGAPVGGLHGDYNPMCLDPNGFTFAANIYADGTATGVASKLCETDILLDIGSFTFP